MAFNPKAATAMFCRAWQGSKDLEHALEVIYTWAAKSSARDRLSMPREKVQLAEAAAAEAGTTLRQLRDCKYRDRETTSKKAAAVKHLRNTGMSYPDIGKALGMHHSTAIYLAKRKG